uniref:Uncharacterized protein n=1 Tax=Ditylenchus dipsaci TaxID=166011 RepID=A0A915DU98_9BILA
MSKGSSAASSESIDYEEDSDYDLNEEKCMETTEIENVAEESEYAQKLTILTLENEEEFEDGWSTSTSMFR